jgi:hypothetical protein
VHHQRNHTDQAHDCSFHSEHSPRWHELLLLHLTSLLWQCRWCSCSAARFHCCQRWAPNGCRVVDPRPAFQSEARPIQETDAPVSGRGSEQAPKKVRTAKQVPLRAAERHFTNDIPLKFNMHSSKRGFAIPIFAQRTFLCFHRSPRLLSLPSTHHNKGAEVDCNGVMRCDVRTVMNKMHLARRETPNPCGLAREDLQFKSYTQEDMEITLSLTVYSI